MKLLFLDVDGVLNSDDYRGEAAAAGKTIDVMDPENVKHLNTLQRLVPDLRIVVSSTWRLMYPLEQIERKMRQAGYEGEALLDRTPCHGRGDPFDANRGLEIMDWLEKNASGTSFAIVDDHAEMGPVLDALVQTDPDVGLTGHDVERIVKLLEE